MKLFLIFLSAISSIFNSYSKNYVLKWNEDFKYVKLIEFPNDYAYKIVDPFEFGNTTKQITASYTA